MGIMRYKDEVVLERNRGNTQIIGANQLTMGG